MSINSINNSFTSYPTANSSFVNLPESKEESLSSDQHLANVQDNIKKGKYRLQTFTERRDVADTVVWGDKLFLSLYAGIKVMDIKSGKELQMLKLKGAGWSVKKILVVNGNQLISGSSDGVIKLWDLESG